MNEGDRRRFGLPVDNSVIVKKVPPEKSEVYPQYKNCVVVYLPDGRTIITAKTRYTDELQ